MARPSSASALPKTNQLLTHPRLAAANYWASSSDLGGKEDEEKQSRNCENAQTSVVSKQQPKRKYVDPECTVEDISLDQDKGYEADVDGELPTETEEPESESDFDGDAMLRSRRGKYGHASPCNLAKVFSKLHCDPERSHLSKSKRARVMKRDNRITGSLKRSHSDDSLTDTDGDTLERELNSSADNNRVKRRFQASEALPLVLSYGRDIDDPNEGGRQMDIDSP